MAIVLVLYRNWRYEQELDSLLWKVNYKDIQIKEEKEETLQNDAIQKSNIKVSEKWVFFMNKLLEKYLFLFNNLMIIFSQLWGQVKYHLVQIQMLIFVIQWFIHKLDFTEVECLPLKMSEKNQLK